MQKLLLSLFLLIVSSGAFAQHRSEQEAMQIAQEFFISKTAAHPSRLVAVPQTKVQAKMTQNMAKSKKTPAQSSSCYIINDEANNRFVIVSADERMYKILGYSDSGLFDTEREPYALFELIDSYDRQSMLMDKNRISPLYLAAEDNNQESLIVAPMITSKWGQSEPFNAACPIDKSYDKDTLSVTGCIATALAQIINYWRQPARCQGGTYSYFNPLYSGLQYLHFDYDSYEIDWDNLVDDYNGATEEQKAEVAKLMYACGVSVAMGYSADGSGTMDYNIPYALKRYFGYNPNVVYRNRDYYTRNEWHTMIMSELQAGRPILYAGYDENHRNGHEYILDGCDSKGLYHFNFGQAEYIPSWNLLWSGIGDGYYRIDAVRPTFLGEEWGDFSFYQSMICNISPNVVGEYEDTFYSDIFALIPKSNFSTTVCFAIQASCYSSETNDSYATSDLFSGKIGVGLFDLDFNFVGSMYEDSFSGRSGKKYERLDTDEYITLNTSKMEDGKEYIIAPYAISDNALNPTIMRSHMFPTWYSEEYKNNAYFYYKATYYSGLDWLLLIPNSVDDENDGLKGDANGDGIIDVADIVYMVNYIMEKPATDFVVENADMDDDGVIDVADITLVVKAIMNSDSPSLSRGQLKNGAMLRNLSNGTCALNCTNAANYVAAQFEVTVPADSEISEIKLNDSRMNGHQVIWHQIAPNRYRVVIYSANNHAFVGNKGDLLAIKTNSGNVNVSIEKAIFVTEQGEKNFFNVTNSHTNGISNVSSGVNRKTIFTIDGRQMNAEKLTKGIYVVNGKKQVVK